MFQYFRNIGRKFASAFKTFRSAFSWTIFIAYIIFGLLLSTLYGGGILTKVLIVVAVFVIDCASYVMGLKRGVEIAHEGEAQVEIRIHA